MANSLICANFFLLGPYVHENIDYFTKKVFCLRNLLFDQNYFHFCPSITNFGQKDYVDTFDN